MSFLLDQRSFGHKGLLRSIRTFVCGFPHFDGATINQGGGGSVGSGEIFVASGPLAQTGRLRLTCTLGGGAGVGLFTLNYINDDSPQPTGSPPGPLSPVGQSPVFPVFAGTLVAEENFEENDVWIFVETTVDWVAGNFIDIDLVPSPNTTPWLERRFVTDSDKSPLFGTELEWFAQGLGDTSPQAAITVGMQTHTDVGSSIFNILTNYFTAFTDTSPETVYANQPGRGGTAYMMSNVAGLDYHITVNSRRFMVAARMNTGRWTTCYCGFIEPLAGLSSFPYPIANGGVTSLGTTFNLATNDVRYSSFWDPGGDGTAVQGSLSIRTPVGGNQEFANKTNGSAEPGSFTAAAIDNIVWPWGSSHQIEGAEFRLNTAQAGRGPLFGSPQAREFAIFRAQLFSADFAGVSQTLGFLDGVFFIPGETASGIAGGDTFVLESPEVTYLVVQDTFRATAESFAAFRMDPD